MKKKIKSSISETVFHENEVKTNRIASYAILFLSSFLLVLSVLAELGLFDFGMDMATVMIAGMGVLGEVVFIIGLTVRFSGVWLKYLILAQVLVASGIMCFLYPLNASFLTYGAIIIAAKYYDKKLVLSIGAVSCALYWLILWENIHFEEYSVIIRDFHMLQEIRIWQMPEYVLLNYALPHTVFFMITTFVCYSITVSGRSLVKKQAVIASEAAGMESELKSASEIQKKALVPKEYETENGKIKITAFIHPARQVGGDFYHYFRKGDNLYLLVADVSDKGLSAAMFMMKAKSAVNYAVENSETLEKAMFESNNFLCKDNTENMFLSLWIGCINVHSGRGKYISCGHVCPIVRHKNGKAEYLENDPGLLLGLFENTAYKSCPLNLEDGDYLLMFTDGLTDSVNTENEFFGQERLMRVAEQTGEEIDICEGIVSELKRFSEGAPQFDDITLLGLEVKETEKGNLFSGTFPAEDGSSEKVLNGLENHLKNRHCPDDIRREIEVSVDEICTNISDYAYPDTEGCFEVEAYVGSNCFDMTVSDSGIPFNPLESEDPDVSGEPLLGGLGIFLTKKLMDGVDYKREEDKNILSLHKIWGI